jgi:uncharacterized protein
MPSTTERALLDASVLIALTVTDHEHHEAARTWFGSRMTFATTPSTQGSLVRYLVRVATVEHAVDALALMADNDRHEFWADDEPYRAPMLLGVTGHRQVTDAYLAATARRRGAVLATFDRGLAVLRPDVVELIDL